LQQLNSLARRKVLDEKKLVELWDVDIASVCETKKLKGFIQKQQTLIEKLEVSYHGVMFKLNIIRRLYDSCMPELSAILFAFAILYYANGVASIFIG
jgi:hypothetical protein